MAEDSTRRLLRVFGIAVTECEDALAVLDQTLRQPGVPAPAVTAAVAAYGRAARELDARWTEVSRIVLGYRARAQETLEAFVGARAVE